VYAGGLMGLIGAVAITQGMAVDIGSLVQMGPGFMPIALGIALILLGVATALGAPAEPADPDHSATRPQWRAWLCIIAGPVLFILLGPITGFIPASFAAVFVSALGDREATAGSAALLGAGVTVVGGVLFLYLLHVPFPLLQWGAP
jgi:putative Ca2+/H+ antiporter (TMEM165/GDT1 family)